MVKYKAYLHLHLEVPKTKLPWPLNMIDSYLRFREKLQELINAILDPINHYICDPINRKIYYLLKLYDDNGLYFFEAFIRENVFEFLAFHWVNISWFIVLCIITRSIGRLRKRFKTRFVTQSFAEQKCDQLGFRTICFFPVWCFVTWLATYLGDDILWTYFSVTYTVFLTFAFNLHDLGLGVLDEDQLGEEIYQRIQEMPNVDPEVKSKIWTLAKVREREGRDFRAYWERSFTKHGWYLWWCMKKEFFIWPIYAFRTMMWDIFRFIPFFVTLFYGMFFLNQDKYWYAGTWDYNFWWWWVYIYGPIFLLTFVFMDSEKEATLQGYETFFYSNELDPVEKRGPTTYWPYYGVVINNKINFDYIYYVVMQRQPIKYSISITEWSIYMRKEFAYNSYLNQSVGVGENFEWWNNRKYMGIDYDMTRSWELKCSPSETSLNAEESRGLVIELVLGFFDDDDEEAEEIVADYDKLAEERGAYWEIFWKSNVEGFARLEAYRAKIERDYGHEQILVNKYTGETKSKWKLRWALITKPAKKTLLERIKAEINTFVDTHAEVDEETGHRELGFFDED